MVDSGSDLELCDAAARGRSPDEGGPAALELLGEWRRVLGGGEPLRRLLRLRGQRTPRTRLLSAQGVASDVAWRSWLEGWLRASNAARPAEVDPEDPLALLRDHVLSQLDRALASEALELAELLGSSAQRALHADLDRQLRALIDPCLGELAAALPAARLLAPEALAPRLLADAAGDGLRPLLRRWPALARLLATRAVCWVESLRELLVRLSADLPALAARFGAEAALAGGPPVEALECGLGDPHHRGRRVAALQLRGGLRLAYKPRPLDGEQLYDDVLAAAAAADPRLAQRRLRLLARPDYGWVEWVEAEPVVEGAAAARLALRLGAHLAHAHALGLHDLHEENLLLAGEWPVLVDLECCLAAPLGEPSPPPPAVAHDLPDTLVFARWNGWGDRWQPGGLLQPAWAGAQRDALCEGYRLALAWWCSLVGALDGDLFGEGSPLRRARRARGRLVIRPTHAYRRLLAQAQRPAALTDIRRFDGRLDALARGDWGGAVPAALWGPLLEAERAALHRLDIPCFEVRADSRALFCGGQRVHDSALGHAPLERLRARLASLAELADGRGERCLAAALAPPLAPRGAAADAARAIARHLVAQALIGPDGGRWLGRRLEPARGLLHTAPLDEGLYAGNAGVALFLLAAGRLLVEPEAEALGEATLRRCAQSRQGMDGWGFAEGLAGRLLALTLAGALTDEPRWAESARALASADGAMALTAALDAARRPADVVSEHGNELPHGGLDLYGGLAGLALACSACGAGTLASRAAEALAARLPGPGEPLLAGLAHGASGIAAALARCAVGAADADLARRLWASARAWLERERSLFSAAHGEWRDRRFEAATFTSAWCHGAPGVLISRQTLRAAARCRPAELELDEPLAQDLARAAARTRAFVDRSLHAACCGEAGRVEALALLGDAPAARARAEALAAAAAADGAWSLALQPPQAPSTPGLYQGLAGVGWALLRAAPGGDRLPSPLAPWLLSNSAAGVVD